MPVTVKLSRRFYDTFGDELANELVGLFNQVDATYRSEIREMFDYGFARLDAKLEQRLAESTALGDRRIAELTATMERRLAELRSELIVMFERRLAETQTRILAWNFAFWITTLLAIAGSRLL